MPCAHTFSNRATDLGHWHNPPQSSTSKLQPALPIEFQWDGMPYHYVAYVSYGGKNSPVKGKAAAQV